MDQDADLRSSSRRQLAIGALGIAVSTAGLGFVYGLSAREAGSSPIEAVAMSTLVFAGAAQFAAVGHVLLVAVARAAGVAELPG